MASYTVSSQHYQEYSDYPNIVDEKMVHHPAVRKTLDKLNETYQQLIADGVPKEEARQILPNSKAVNILWTINARSLINFLNLRMCHRNTKEIKHFATTLCKLLEDKWWPELFSLIGPDCHMKGECSQGIMGCGKEFTK